MSEFVFIEIFNLIFHNHIFLTGAVLGGLLFGGAVAAGLSSKMSPKTVVMILFLPAVFLLSSYFMNLPGYIFQIRNFGYLDVFLINCILACVFSPLFPKILSSLQYKNANLAPLIYGFNVISLAFGAFLALLLYFYFGIMKTSKALVAIYMILLPLSYIWLKAINSQRLSKHKQEGINNL